MFFGAILNQAKTFKFGQDQAQKGEVLCITNAVLSADSKGNAELYIKSNDGQYLVVSLNPQRPHATINIYLSILDESQLIIKGSGTIHLTGFFQAQQENDLGEEEEDEIKEEGSEEQGQQQQQQEQQQPVKEATSIQINKIVPQQTQKVLIPTKAQQNQTLNKPLVQNKNKPNKPIAPVSTQNKAQVKTPEAKQTPAKVQNKLNQSSKANLPVINKKIEQESDDEDQDQEQQVEQGDQQQDDQDDDSDLDDERDAEDGENEVEDQIDDDIDVKPRKKIKTQGNNNQIHQNQQKNKNRQQNQNRSNQNQQKGNHQSKGNQNQQNKGVNQRQHQSNKGEKQQQQGGNQQQHHNKHKNANKGGNEKHFNK